MKVITCHKSPDFDAIASSMAAKKLYPDAVLALPPLPPYTMKNFFIQTIIYLYSPKPPEEFKLDDIDTLIIVDTHSKERIGVFGKIAEKVKTICYDHHEEGDIKNCILYTDKVGANTTLMINELRKKNIEITPDEATLFLTGIYEDTGNLTYPSTTAKDFQACSWLLQKGGNLTLVSQILEREMTAPQVNMLNELIRNKRIYEIDNLNVAVTFASFDEYIHEAAISVEKMLKIEKLDAVIAAIRMENRIHVIGRSKRKEINIGKFAKLFGGGGHTYAASATVKDITLTEVIEKISEKLNNLILDALTAEKIMTYPPRSIEYNRTVEEANEMMTRFGINVLPVLKKDKLVGIITRQITQRAFHHHLQKRSIEDFMIADFETAAYNTTFEKIKKIIIDEKQKLLPVLKKGKLIGVITRTNILHLLGGEQIKKHTLKMENIAHKMEKSLPSDIYILLKKIGSLAQQLSFNAYIVGGFVRDLIMNRENLDIDIVIEGNGITFAREFARLVKGKVATHEKFNTATVILPDGFKFDVATARQEYYEVPGSLPSVELSSIKQDLYRRDFSINTLAIKLNNNFGDLLDYFGGLKDIKDKKIRVLHTLSFIEDPTRIFRAIRFAVKFNFEVGKQTEKLIKKALELNLLNQVDKKRLFIELFLILKEKEAPRAIEKLNKLGVFSNLEKNLVIEPACIKHMETASSFIDSYLLLHPAEKVNREIVFLLILEHYASLHNVSLTQILNAPENIKKIVLPIQKEKKHLLHQLENETTDVSIYYLLKPLTNEQLIFLLSIARLEQTKNKIARFINQLKFTKNMIDGNDLMRLGVKPSPLLGKILDSVFKGILSGEINSKEEALKKAREIIKENLSIH